MMSKQIAFLLAIFVVLGALFVIAERTFSPSFQQCVGAAEENPSAYGITVSYASCTARILQSYEALVTALATMVIAAFTCWLVMLVGDPFTYVPDDPQHTLRFTTIHHTEGNCADDECN